MVNARASRPKKPGPRAQPAGAPGPDPVPVIPARYAHIAFGLLLSGMMSFIVSGISTVSTVGLGEGFVRAWMGGWLPGWAVAFPVVLFVAPLARKMVAAITIQE